jgi:hypothetical protein
VEPRRSERSRSPSPQHSRSPSQPPKKSAQPSRPLLGSSSDEAEISFNVSEVFIYYLSSIFF